MSEQAYLGDGVYIVPDPDAPTGSTPDLIMTTGGHYGSGQSKNIIVLEHETVRELYAYLRHHFGDM